MAQSVPVPHTITIYLRDGDKQRKLGPTEYPSKGECERVRRDARVFHGENFCSAFIDRAQEPA